MDRIVLVIGGTGLLGRPVVHGLSEAGFSPRVLTRNPAEASFPGAEAEVVEGDATDPRSVRRALAGCWGVHLSVSGPAELPSAEVTASLADEMGISRMTYVSGSTVHEDNRWFPMVDAKLRAEAAVARSGVPWTVFRPTWPFETIRRFVRGGRATVIGKHPTPYHWFAADDFARMVVTSLFAPGAVDRTLYVHGPDALSMHEVVDRYRAVVHPEVKKTSTLPIPLGRVIAFLTRNELLSFACDLMSYFDRAPERGDPTEANRLLRAPATTFDEWLDAQVATSTA